MIVEQMLKNAQTPLLHIADVSGSALFQGDCLEIMPLIPDNSIDCIITDPPYGTTACKWDSVIPFDKMWGQLNRIIKPNGAIVLFGSEPFSSALRMSNIKNYKYDWVWNKKKGGNIMLLKQQPYKIHEIISVFNTTKETYFPIMESQKPRTGKTYSAGEANGIKNYGDLRHYDKKYPKSIIDISNANQAEKQHPTQKPLELMEYLIETYTKQNETVLDFTMGSGSTMVASKISTVNLSVLKRKPIITRLLVGGAVFSITANGLRICVCLPLARSFKLLQMFMGQIAQNRCYA